jgi:hypothetical protein
LTHETLKDLGVTSVGHRVKLLDAIAALRAEGGLKAPSPAAAPAGQSATPPSAASVAQAAGERGYLTVLFCPSCSAIWRVRPASLLGLMLRSGATWSARIWMLPRRHYRNFCV